MLHEWVSCRPTSRRWVWQNAFAPLLLGARIVQAHCGGYLATRSDSNISERQAGKNPSWVRPHRRTRSVEEILEGCRGQILAERQEAAPISTPLYWPETYEWRPPGSARRAQSGVGRGRCVRKNFSGGSIHHERAFSQKERKAVKTEPTNNTNQAEKLSYCFLGSKSSICWWLKVESDTKNGNGTAASLFAKQCIHNKIWWDVFLIIEYYELWIYCLLVMNHAGTIF